MEIFAQKLVPCSSKKHKKRDIHAQDRISELPDDILISILSCMTMKEAAKTSVLSRRWEKLWTFHPRLDFDGSKTLFKFKRQIMDFVADNCRVEKALDLERVGYINWVNHIVESCRIPTAAIDEFRVRFDLDESYKQDIDGWVRFAFEKKVKRFELNLVGYNGLMHDIDYGYPLCLRDICLTRSLTSLVLKDVNVSGEVLDKFISNSPFLECLCVRGLRSIVNLKVAGPSLYLKYLEVFNCWNIESLELDAANLLSLKYYGRKIKIPFMNVPNLVEISIGGQYLQCFTSQLPRISTFCSQLQKLAFHMFSIEKWFKKRRYPILSQLRELELELDARDDDSLLFFSSLINACPLLNRLSLELHWTEPFVKKRKVNKARKSPHHSLKVVEIIGFVGQTIDTEFCMYLIENAIMLEKIIIDPCRPCAKGGPFKYEDQERVKAARKCAEQLKSKYFLGDKLVFCYSDN